MEMPVWASPASSARWIGAKQSIVVSLLIWAGVVIYAYGGLQGENRVAEFFILGIFIALVLGGSQAISRPNGVASGALALTSLAVFQPMPLIGGLFSAVPYTTTKHAVVGLSQALRTAGAGHGIRVSVLCPGGVETGIWDRVP